MAHAIVLNLWFERGAALAIFLNAVYIGISTEYRAQHQIDRTPVAFQVAELLFLLVFAAEMGLRLLVHRCWLFRCRTPQGTPNHSMHWNILDCSVIGLQVCELVLTSCDVKVKLFSGLSVMRLLRLMRLVRIVRLAKVLRFVRDLRMIVYSIWRSLSLFFWAMVALLLLNFMCSVCFTEFVHTRKLEGHVEETDDLDRYFGSLGKTMFSLFQAVTGGVDWSVMTDALGAEPTSITVLAFLLYVAFTTFAVLNVVSGVVLETAMEIAHDEKEAFVLRNAKMVFNSLDKNKDGTITWPLFERALNHPHIQSFFDNLRIHISEARALFDLLDMSGDGHVSADEFLNGCLRVRGPSRALDLLVLSREVSQLFEMHALPQQQPPNRSSSTRPSFQSDGDEDNQHRLRSPTRNFLASYLRVPLAGKTSTSISSSPGSSLEALDEHEGLGVVPQRRGVTPDE